MIINDERIRLGEWEFGDRLRTEKDPVKSKPLASVCAAITLCLGPVSSFALQNSESGQRGQIGSLFEFKRRDFHPHQLDSCHLEPIQKP